MLATRSLCASAQGGWEFSSHYFCRHNFHFCDTVLFEPLSCLTAHRPLPCPCRPFFFNWDRQVCISPLVLPFSTFFFSSLLRPPPVTHKTLLFVLAQEKVLTMLLRYPVSKCCTTPNLCQQVHHHSLTNNPDSSIKHAGQLRDHRGQKWRVPETICPVSFLNYCLHVTSGNKCVVKFSLFSISCLRKCESHSQAGSLESWYIG